MQHDRDGFSDRGKRSPLVENHFPKIGKSASVEIHRIVRGQGASRLTSQLALPVNDIDPRNDCTRQILRPAATSGVTPVTRRNALCHASSRDRHCDARCKAYRSGLRRALAEVTIQRVNAEQRRAEMTGRRMDDSRRGKVTAFKYAAGRINRLMLEPCPFCLKELTNEEA